MESSVVARITQFVDKLRNPRMFHLHRCLVDHQARADIGDMFQEILVPRDAEKDIVAEYCKGNNFEQTLYYIDLYKPFPDIYWFLWSLIQLNISKIEFDYYNYGKVKYENAVKNLAFLRQSYGVAI